MLSFFRLGVSSKRPTVLDASTHKTATEFPPIVDLNILGKESQELKETVGSSKETRSRFSLWPSAKTAAPTIETAPALNPDTTKVIAMKAIGCNTDDEFIDIQVRKLSYAEAASLKLTESLTMKPSPSSKVAAAASAKAPNVVIDHDTELENSITDFELANELGNTRKFRDDLLAYEEMTANPEVDFEDALERENVVDHRFKKSIKRMKKRRGSNKK
ncbi:unnamed protein product [Kuraishia capsulata CBS 1993]|uniref:Uncharacterized protein n=1 Tax=Kuraishia capsulata CBS 1993 TaxID=1382522 RepID=W6MNU0_9ASCO|nr:uncharacterized protein KUCA_T00004278001 [Kuraishia capsulata CBS 1993]CDK28296.1 unnamed protein product [Kuraishia capsulata CBS 1993]